MHRVLVVIHLYYPEQVDTILNNLKNVSLEYDLYCSIGNAEHHDEIRDKVLKFDSKARIIDVKNVGYDVWPFIHIINGIDLSLYEYIIKLHTKRDMPDVHTSPLGNGFWIGPCSNWRDCLYSFVATRDNFRKCLVALEKPTVGMCARFNVIHNAPNHTGVLDYAKKYHPNYTLNLRHYNFVAGTMFIAKAAPFQMLKDLNITEDLFDTPKEKHKMQFAHVVERLFGAIIYKSNMEIVDPFTPLDYIKEIKHYYRKQKWVKRGINYLLIPCFIQKYRRQLKRKLLKRFRPMTIDKIVEYDIQCLADQCKKYEHD
ncbi:MAG: hypothetical protein J6W40_01120 [Alphaproteobacteria bacterium]|nr:hypothetical protein [Alphaproteobacteria bacterium]